MLAGTKILVTGPTGQVALPVTLGLAADNEVWGVARFSDEAARARLEAAGVRCVPTNLVTADFADLPRDFDFVLNFAVLRGGDRHFDRDFAANCEAVGLLMQHCASATAFLHCSSTAVYQPAGRHLLRETDPLGDNHRVWFPTYSLAKIAAEAVARTGARQFGLRTTIARLNVPYGDNGGWPAMHLEQMVAGQAVAVHPDQPNLFNPIHDDDIARQVPRLLEAATVPATVVNWAGEQTSIEEWCGYFGELTGLEARFEVTGQSIGSVTTDNTRMHAMVGPAEVGWREGMRRVVEHRHPELLR